MHDTAPPPAPSRALVSLAPRRIILGANVRPTELKPDFVASVRRHGVLGPVLVVPHGERDGLPDGGPYQVLIGRHRVAAAIEAELEQIDAVVRYDLDGDAARIIAQVTENKHRSDMRPTEFADAYAQLSLELGLSVAQIAQEMAEDEATVSGAIRLAKLPAAARSAADANGLDLAQVAQIAEFEGDKKAYARLVRAIERGQSIDYALVEERVRRTQRERKAQAVQKAKGGGATVIAEPRGFGYSESVAVEVRYLKDESGAVYDRQSHASCPGHAGFYRTWGGDEDNFVWVCTDPKRYGHTVTRSYTYKTQAEIAAENALKERQARLAQALAEVAQLRIEFVGSACRAKKPPQGAMRFSLLTLFAARAAHLDAARRAQVLELMGAGAADPGEHAAAYDRRLGRTAEAALACLLLAHVAALAEANLRARGTWGFDPAFASGWLEYLSGIGYGLSEPEIALLVELRSSGDGEDEDGIDEDDEGWAEEDE